MTTISFSSSKFAAAACAFVLSVALIGGTVAMPDSANARAVAYVGVVA